MQQISQKNQKNINTTTTDVPVTMVTLSRSYSNLEIGQVDHLIAAVLPTNATNKNVIWGSSAFDVATVIKGTVTAHSPGTAIITATARDGSGKRGSCTVNVDYGEQEYHIIANSGNGNALFVGDSSKNIFYLESDTMDKNTYVRMITYRNRGKFKITGGGNGRKIRSCLNEDYMLCNNGQNQACVYSTENNINTSEIATNTNSNLTIECYNSSLSLYTIKLTNSNLYLTSSNGNVVWNTYNTSNPSNQIWKIQGKLPNIHNGIDTSTTLTESTASKMKLGREEFAIRYYAPGTNNAKRLLTSEVSLLHNKGINIVSVYQDYGQDVSYFSSAHATADANAALNSARTLGQPSGTAIYFAVDYDAGNDLNIIANYFSVVKNIIGNEYKIGVYGCGAVCQRIKQDLGYADYSWLSHSTGFTGYTSYETTDKYNILQAEPRYLYDINVDEDVAVGDDYGQW